MNATLEKPLPSSPATEEKRLLVSVVAQPPLRVAFTGQAGSGKSTHAKLLREKYKGDVLSFATPIKKLTAELFGERMAEAQFARTANQELGSLGRRLAGPNFWVEKLLEKVSESRNCFIDDCRYQSEFVNLKDLGFIVIRLIAPHETLVSRRPTMTISQWQHESERDATFLHADAIFDSSEAEAAVHHKIVDAIERMRADALN